jgi:hypothetical protein
VGGWSFNLGASYCTLYSFSLNFNEETSSFSHVTSPQESQVTLNTFSLNVNEETSSFSHVTSPQASQVPSTPSPSTSMRRHPPPGVPGNTQHLHIYFHLGDFVLHLRYSLQASQVTLNIFTLNFNKETSSFSHVTSPQVSQVTLNQGCESRRQMFSSITRPTFREI